MLINLSHTQLKGCTQSGIFLAEEKTKSERRHPDEQI